MCEIGPPITAAAYDTYRICHLMCELSLFNCVETYFTVYLSNAKS